MKKNSKRETWAFFMSCHPIIDPKLEKTPSFLPKRFKVFEFLSNLFSIFFFFIAINSAFNTAFRFAFLLKSSIATSLDIFCHRHKGRYFAANIK